MVRFLRKLESSLYRNSDCVIVLAKGSIEYVRQRGARHVCHLPNGPDLNSITTDLSQEQAKDTFSIDRSRFCLMYTGAHGEANALDGLIDAARILEKEYPNCFQILLVGDGPEKQKLQTLACDVSCVEFRAPVAKRDIPGLLAAADGLILTLRDVPLFKYGVSPNKLYDYYAAMRPVIVSVGGAVNDEVDQLGLGFTAEPESPRHLADAIIKLSLLPTNEREAMGTRALQLVQRVYSRQALLHTLTKTISDLM
jgi:glycosyltransferase involved in cell wall biosynthesis